MKTVINWELGQQLLPEHLEAMQAGDREHSYSLVDSLFPTKFYGLNNIKIDVEFLKINILKIIAFEYIEPTGIVLDLERNCTISNLNMKEIKESNSSIYINFYKKIGTFKHKNQAISCINYNGILGDKIDCNADIIVHILQVESNINKEWSVADKYLPVSLNFHIELFAGLKNKILSLLCRIEYYRDRLEKNDNFAIKRIDFKNVLFEKHILNNYLIHSSPAYKIHPCRIYNQLLRIYFRLSVYCDIKITNDNFVYEQSNISDCFNLLIESIEKILIPEKIDISYIPFQYDGTLFTIKNLDDAVLHAAEIYFVFQKINPNQFIDIDNLKISSLSRLHIVDKMALPGVGKAKISSFAFEHHLNENCDFFKLSMGKEWDYIIKEKTIGFKPEEQHKNFTFYIYYR